MKLNILLCLLVLLYSVHPARGQENKVREGELVYSAMTPGVVFSESLTAAATIASRRFENKRQILIDGKGMLYALGDKVISIFTTEGDFVKDWSPTEERGQHLGGFFVDEQGDYSVLLTGFNPALQSYDDSGNLKSTAPLRPERAFLHPSLAIWRDPQGHFLVALPEGICEFSALSEPYDFWGQKLLKPSLPLQAAVFDAKGNLYLLDAKGIEELEESSHSLRTLVLADGTDITGRSTPLKDPQALVKDEAGHLYVVCDDPDKKEQRPGGGFDLYTLKGKFLGHVSVGQTGNTSIATTPAGDICLFNGEQVLRLNGFKPEPGYEKPLPNDGAGSAQMEDYKPQWDLGPGHR